MTHRICLRPHVHIKYVHSMLWPKSRTAFMCLFHYPSSVQFRLFYHHIISCDIPQIQGAIIRKTKQRHNNFISVFPCSIYGANKWDYYHWMSIKRNWILKISEYFFSFHFIHFFWLLLLLFFILCVDEDKRFDLCVHPTWSIRMLPPSPFTQRVTQDQYIPCIYRLKPGRIWIPCT